MACPTGWSRLYDFDCGSAEAELEEDLRPVLQVLDPGRAGEVFRHHDRVAGHEAGAVERGAEKARLALAESRAVGAQDVDAALVCFLARAAGEREVVADALVRAVEEGRLVEHRAEHAHRR